MVVVKVTTVWESDLSPTSAVHALRVSSLVHEMLFSDVTGKQPCWFYPHYTPVPPKHSLLPGVYRGRPALIRRRSGVCRIRPLPVPRKYRGVLSPTDGLNVWAVVLPGGQS